MLFGMRGRVRDPAPLELRSALVGENSDSKRSPLSLALATSSRAEGEGTRFFWIDPRMRAGYWEGSPFCRLHDVSVPDHENQYSRLLKSCEPSGGSGKGVGAPVVLCRRTPKRKNPGDAFRHSPGFSVVPREMPVGQVISRNHAGRITAYRFLLICLSGDTRVLQMPG